jgi:epoxide hydrolase-like predicted phosphatase
MPQLFKAIIFDMGGVFLRTASLTGRRKLARQYGKTIDELSDLVFFSPMSIASEKGELSREEFWKQLLPFIGAAEGAQGSFEMDFFSGDVVDVELEHFVGALRPRYKLGMLSNAFSGTRDWIQERYTFLDLFDVSLFSYEAGLRKPDETFFRLMLDRLQVAPHETLFVDDFRENILGAQTLGIQTVWYRDRDAAFAYLKSILDTNAQE